MIALVVTLQVQPERHEEFVTAITENAARSVGDEPGCVRFDVSRGVDDELRYWLYELYVDQAAVDAHRAARHFAVWRSAADRCVVPGSQVNSFATVQVSQSSETREGDSR